MDLEEIDISAVGELPWIAKVGLVLVLCVVLAAAWYFFDIKSQHKSLAKIEKEEIKLKEEYELKQSKAANLEAYREQVKEMRESFGSMLRQLPNKTEVAELLVDVSQTGLAAGLEFELFRPDTEQPKEFYAELPISIRVTGSYHQFGEFISGLAALPRIVTIHNIRISPKSNEPDAPLVLEATAKTYRYLDEEEPQG